MLLVGSCRSLLCARKVAQKWTPESQVLGEHNTGSHMRCYKVSQGCSFPGILGYYGMSDSAGRQ